jgi:hypothetical protein
MNIDSDVTRVFAKEFASQLSNALLANAEGSGIHPADESESCKLCVKIFGCLDCCEPVCKSASPAPAPSSDNNVKESTTAANTNKDSSSGSNQAAASLSKQIVLAGHEAAQQLAKIEKQLGSIASATATAKGNSAEASHASASLSRMPCECKSNDCKECPDDAVHAAYKKHLQQEKKTLSEAEKAVAVSNAILQERIAALHATNEMAIRQGLGAYGPESSEEVWPAREPTPGKSEQVGSQMSDMVKQLVEKVGQLQAKTNNLKLQLYEAERAATHGAEVTANQRHLISELAGQIQEQHKTARALHQAYSVTGLARYGGTAVEKLATQTIFPYYEQPEYNGGRVFEAVKYFKHHPHQVKADIGPHPILSQD